jgi:predicted PurR-regulated permease PerM
MRYEELDKSTKVILQVVFVFLALWFLWLIRDIILLLIISLILASAMEPLVDALHDKKVPRVISVFFVYLIFIGVAVLVIYSIIPPVVEQIKILQANLPEYGKVLQTQFAGIDVQSFLQQMASGFSGGNVVQNTFGVFNGALNAIAVVVISVYLVAEEKGMKTFVSSLLPSHHHEFALGLINKIQKKMGGWVLGQLIISFGIFLFTYIGLLLLHVQYALVLALLSGLFEVVPYIGPFLSSIPAMFIAFAQDPAHFSLVIWVAVLYLLVHEVEGYVLVPKVMEKTTNTSPLLTLVALMVGYQLAGIIGLVISVPLATALTVTVNEFWPNNQN